MQRDEGQENRETKCVVLLELDKRIWPEEREYLVIMNSLNFQHMLNLNMKLGIVLGKILYGPVHGKMQIN